MDEPNNNDLISQDGQPVAANDAVEINVADSQAEEAPEMLVGTGLPTISGDIPAEPTSISQTPETNPADNIIFTPEDYQKMTGGPEDNAWQSVAPAPMPRVEPFPESPMDTSVSESVAPSTPLQPTETSQNPQTVFAPVPMEATEHYEEPVSNIPNPESFYVGYKPAPPVQAAPTGLEKRINQVSAEQAAKNKKTLIITLVSVVCTLLVAGGGIFGFITYQKQASKKILTSAWQNLTKMTETSADIALGYDGNEVKATFGIDKDSDMRFKLDVREFPMELVYIKKSDKLYIYDMAGSAAASTATATSKMWIEASNAEKAFKKYSEEAQKTSQTDIGGYINSDMVKYFQKEPNEIIDGVDSYKYVFNPPAEAMDEALNQAKNQEALKDIPLKASNFKVEMWIGKKDNKFTKIKLTAGFDFNLGETENNYSGTLDIKFKYDFKEDIKTTTKTKVSQKIDLSKQLEEYISGSLLGGQSGGETNMTDETNIVYAKQLQSALKTYYDDKGNYPASKTVSELLDVLVEQNLIESGLDLSEFKYTHTDTPEGYMIMFKLADQNYAGENVIGESPEKYYALTATE